MGPPDRRGVHSVSNAIAEYGSACNTRGNVITRKSHSARSPQAESQNPSIANVTPIATMPVPPCRAWHFLLLAQKKGTVEAGTRVSGGFAVPSPLTVRQAARKLVLRTRTVRAADPPPWLRGSAAPDGELPPRIINTGMGAVGARRAVPGTRDKVPDMGTQASRLHECEGRGVAKRRSAEAIQALPGFRVLLRCGRVRRVAAMPEQLAADAADHAGLLLFQLYPAEELADIAHPVDAVGVVEEGDLA